MTLPNGDADEVQQRFNRLIEEYELNHEPPAPPPHGGLNGDYVKIRRANLLIAAGLVANLIVSAFQVGRTTEQFDQVKTVQAQILHSLVQGQAADSVLNMRQRINMQRIDHLEDYAHIPRAYVP